MVKERSQARLQHEKVCFHEDLRFGTKRSFEPSSAEEGTLDTKPAYVNRENGSRAKAKMYSKAEASIEPNRQSSNTSYQPYVLASVLTMIFSLLIFFVVTLKIPSEGSCAWLAERHELVVSAVAKEGLNRLPKMSENEVTEALSKFMLVTRILDEARSNRAKVFLPAEDEACYWLKVKIARFIS